MAAQVLWTQVLKPVSICLSICQALIFWEHTGESKFSLMNIYGKQPREQLQIPSFQMKSASLLRHVPKFIWVYQSVPSSCQVWNIHVLSSFCGPSSIFFWKSRGCSDWCWETLFLSSTFYTHSLLLPITRTTNVIQKTLVSFKFSFYPSVERSLSVLFSFQTRSVWRGEVVCCASFEGSLPVVETGVSNGPTAVLRCSSARTLWRAVKTHITGWFPQTWELTCSASELLMSVSVFLF